MVGDDRKWQGRGGVGAELMRGEDRWGKGVDEMRVWDNVGEGS